MTARRDTDDTYTRRYILPSGDVLLLYAAHGRLYLECRQKGVRYPATFAIPLSVAAALFEGGRELFGVAPGTARERA